MKNFYKKLLAFFLGFSNLAVLGLVFQTYVDSGPSMVLFSTNDRQDEIEEIIENKCGGLLNQLKDDSNDSRTSFICPITINRRHDRSSYKLKMTYLVTKNLDNDKASNPVIFTLTSKRVISREGHATEADFDICNDCNNEGEKISSWEHLIGAITESAEEIYDKAETEVEEAREEHNRQSREERQANLRASRCEGEWDDDNKDFIEFDIEEKMECNMRKMSRLSSPLEVERFYHHNLKKDLWQEAVSGNDDYVTDFLDSNDFSDPYRYSLSVRSSTGLLRSYTQDWKYRFADLDSAQRREFALALNRELSRVREMTGGNYSHNTERYYLNQGFEGALSNLNEAERRLNPPTTRPTTSPTSIDWDSFRDFPTF